jgi:hypothetical protein
MDCAKPLEWRFFVALWDRASQPSPISCQFLANFDPPAPFFSSSSQTITQSFQQRQNLTNNNNNNNNNHEIHQEQTTIESKATIAVGLRP